MFLFGLQSCNTSIPNEPDAVAAAVVKSLLLGDITQAKAFATSDIARMIDSDGLQNLMNEAELVKDMDIELDHMSDVSSDGAIKNVHFIMRKGDYSCRLRITMVDENGKWLFSNIQHR